MRMLKEDEKSGPERAWSLTTRETNDVLGGIILTRMGEVKKCQGFRLGPGY